MLPIRYYSNRWTSCVNCRNMLPQNSGSNVLRLTLITLKANLLRSCQENGIPAVYLQLYQCETLWWVQFENLFRLPKSFARESGHIPLLEYLYFWTHLTRICLAWFEDLTLQRWCSFFKLEGTPLQSLTNTSLVQLGISYSPISWKKATGP